MAELTGSATLNSIIKQIIREITNFLELARLLVQNLCSKEGKLVFQKLCFSEALKNWAWFIDITHYQKKY
ncbi:MAG TPA: hypothetical protein ENJ51_08590 [Leucothrix mucor]|uniref:Uncharacterized protein n=1 Tax=Leucothrix mucor TaxID=45248 RepID=A0A7V2WVG8_LEUMU|nr:hypothetical protein [Leucothrix mucor]